MFKFLTRIATTIAVLAVSSSLSGQCPEGEIEDCNGNCQPADWIGDGVCDNGIDVPSDFMCAEHNWDNGDCGCPDGYIEDCNGNCHPASWVGDGVCDDGIIVPSDFMCVQFNWDDGDCGCGPGMIQDCNGNCVLIQFWGDGNCHDSAAVNFACNEYDWDGWDCGCPEDHFVDCNGNCWPNELLDLVGDWHCNNEFWAGGGNSDINLDCELFNFDGGDCVVRGCTDPTAENYYEHAEVDDGSCFYGTCPPGTMDCMGNCVPENWLGTNECIEGISEDPEAHLFSGAYPTTLERNIPVDSFTRGVCYLPDGSSAFAATNVGVTRIDFGDDVCAHTTLIPIDQTIYTCISNLDGTRVFAAAWEGGVYVLDVQTNEIITWIDTGDGTLKLETSNSGEWVAVSNHNSNTVTIIDPVTLEITNTISTGTHPRNICFSDDDEHLYVANWNSWTMGVYDTSDWSLITEVPVDYWPQALISLPGDEYVLAANFGFDFTYDHFSVIRTSDWQVIARLQTGAGPEDVEAIGPNGEYLYVSNWGMPCCHGTTSDLCCSSEIDKGTLSVIATPDFNAIVPQDEIPDPIPYLNSTLTTISLEAEYSFGMAVHPNGNELLVSNMHSHSVSVIGFGEEFILPEGDNCDSPLPLLSADFCVEGCTHIYEDDYNEACPFEVTGAPDVVYKYEPEFTEEVNIDLCASPYDTKIYIYEGSCGTYNSGEAIYCNDDFCGVNGWRSRLENVVFEAGETYYIVVDGYGSADSGSFTMCFENVCSGDLNGDGGVDVADLLLLLSGFGTQYDTADLLMFLAALGENCQ